MAVITITPAAVLRSDSAELAPDGIAGESISQGMFIYRDVTDGKLKLADNSTAAKAAVVGMSITAAAANQPLKYITLGDVTVDNVAIGEVYVLSATPGKMCLRSDLISTNFTTILGGAKTVTNFRLSVVSLGVALP